MSQGLVIDIMTFNSYSLQYYSFRKGKIGFGFLKHEDCSCFLVNANFNSQALQYNNITVSKNNFFKMPQRKVNVITERRIFGDDNDLPRDIRDMKSGGSGDSLLRYSSDTGSMTSVACLPLCILCFVFVKVTAYRHFTFAV